MRHQGGRPRKHHHRDGVLPEGITAEIQAGGILAKTVRRRGDRKSEKSIGNRARLIPEGIKSNRQRVGLIPDGITQKDPERWQRMAAMMVAR